MGWRGGLAGRPLATLTLGRWLNPPTVTPTSAPSCGTNLASRCTSESDTSRPSRHTLADVDPPGCCSDCPTPPTCNYLHLCPCSTPARSRGYMVRRLLQWLHFVTPTPASRACMKKSTLRWRHWHAVSATGAGHVSPVHRACGGIRCTHSGYTRSTSSQDDNITNDALSRYQRALYRYVHASRLLRCRSSRNALVRAPRGGEKERLQESACRLNSSCIVQYTSQAATGVRA